MQKRYLVYKGSVFEVTKRDDGLWYDQFGTVIALAEDKNSVDPIDRCGVGILSLPADSSLTDACRPHDYAYSSDAYQAFHYRQDADEMLDHLVAILGHPQLGELFEYLAHEFGASKWENKRTV